MAIIFQIFQVLSRDSIFNDWFKRLYTEKKRSRENGIEFYFFHYPKKIFGHGAQWHTFYGVICMTKDQQFTAWVEHFQQMDQAELELFCIRLLPHMLFRFATFDDDNYRTGNLTCYLYRQVPECVYFTVETPMEIEPALQKLRQLNTGVEWHQATISYINRDESGHARITVGLSLSKIPLRVDAAGILNGK